jgi:hypothetical protein
VPAAKQVWKVNVTEREHMKRTTIALACAIIAPLAFAQTTSTTEKTTATQETATTQTTTTAAGTVNSFTPGQRIVVQTAANANPMSYVIGKTVQFVNKAGKETSPSTIRPGTRVRLDFDSKGAVNRVVLVEQE